MANDAVKNFAVATLTAAVTNVAVSVTVLAGEGAKFPAVPFNATLWDATTYPAPDLDPNVEIVRVTANAADVLTITRAQEGTAAVAHSNTVKIAAGITAKMWTTDRNRTLKSLTLPPAAASAPTAAGVALASIVLPGGSVEVGDTIEVLWIMQHLNLVVAPRCGLKVGGTIVVPETNIGTADAIAICRSTIIILALSGANQQLAGSYGKRFPNGSDFGGTGPNALSEDFTANVTIGGLGYFNTAAGSDTIRPLDLRVTVLKGGV